ncbi:MAG: sigma-70 family RNA polymerase sigma factor [Bacteroidota bacterium]
MSESEFNRLQENLKRGNNDYLGELFEEVAVHCIKKIAHKTGCSIEDAEDLLVDAVVNFRDKVVNDQLIYVKNIKGYIYKTCYNSWLNGKLKKRKVEQNVDEIRERYYTHFENNFGELDTEFNLKKWNIVKQAIEELNERCRDIINYFYVDKIGMKEIAELMGFANANVAKSTKRRCFSKLLSLIDSDSKKS